VFILIFKYSCTTFSPSLRGLLHEFIFAMTQLQTTQNELITVYETEILGNLKL